MKGLAKAFGRRRQAIDPLQEISIGLTARRPRYRKPPSPSGPATDFRGEPIPRKKDRGFLGIAPDPILKGWAANPYLKAPRSVSTMAKFSPFKFLQEVRAETDKVTWPSRRETLVTTAMVFVMVALTAVFFLVADQLIRIVITFILGVAG
jgi:preprotein translocase subunit SecE